ncbi:MAG: DUF3754 domain-containing protein, partial [Gemmataceae bacterium]
MAEYTDREQYIPLRRADVVELLLRDPKLNASERESFQQFAQLISAIWHFEYHQTLENLKDQFAPFDPDAETKPLKQLDPAQRSEEMHKLFDNFVKLMERAVQAS